MKFTASRLLTCIIYCDAVSDRVICNCMQVDSYHGYNICPCMLFFGDVVALLREGYTFV